MRLIRSIASLIHPLLWSTDLQLRTNICNRIFCSPEHRFIYFRIPKSANSTVVLTLVHRMESGSISASDKTGQKSKQLGKKFLQSGIIFPSQLDRYFTFTFVRNPFTRVLSAYLDKVTSTNPKFRKILGVNDRAISFREFLGRLEDGCLMKNVHWAPQSALIPLDASRLNFVGRVENIEADLVEVLDRIFGPGEHKVLRRTAGTTSAENRLKEFYEKHEANLVRKLYARDFELFYSTSANPALSSAAGSRHHQSVARITRQSASGNNL